MIETTKSHVNYVIAEQGSGMEQAVKVLEANKQVLSYVKNTYLDFRIPYTVSDDSFTYQPDFIAKVKGKVEVSIISSLNYRALTTTIRAIRQKRVLRSSLVGFLLPITWKILANGNCWKSTMWMN